KTNTPAERAQKHKAKPAPKPPEEQEDTFNPAAKPLPKPSVLDGAGKLLADADAPSENNDESSEPVLADFSNFPYPWYITQVREALWTAWTARMPSGGLLKCTVKFEILRNGAVKDAGIERSSGNRLFNHAAETSVQNAGPFPPLPADYYEDLLTVHVEFKAME
ncbi:MAG: TonB C-terminal domain-containing protein, partial [Elusimicrobia bacterium]|nr:TonB C-terminal domain-containing protein [Elusimicrobiota bacterium]